MGKGNRTAVNATFAAGRDTERAQGNRAQVRVTQRRAPPTTGAARARKKFLRFFPGGFRDPLYLAWERDYKWKAHQQWVEQLSRATQIELIAAGHYQEFARRAVRIESRTNLLFSFEKMALRDAVSSAAGARIFAEGLHDFLYGRTKPEVAFARWVEALGRLPRRQTRVLTWPLATVFGFIAHPERHIFLKPVVTRIAAERYGVPFEYASRPSWDVYAGLIAFARRVGRDNADLRPRDMIDLQSFIWVQGSDEYA